MKNKYDTLIKYSLEFQVTWGFKFDIPMTDTVAFSKSLNISGLQLIHNSSIKYIVPTDDLQGLSYCIPRTSEKSRLLYPETMLYNFMIYGKQHLKHMQGNK